MTTLSGNRALRVGEPERVGHVPERVPQTGDDV
jgi:hypothetical protein